jgi:YfiH family protein
MPAAPAASSTLHSPLLASIGVPHAFSTRLGGVSSGPFATLNFGNPGDLAAPLRDPRSNIDRNWQLLGRAIGAAIPAAAEGLMQRSVVEVHQVHGDTVSVVRANAPIPRGPDGRDPRADAIVTDDPGRLAAVRVADCTPVLIASSDGAIVAAVHAGWRGTVANIIAGAVRAMTELGASPGAMLAAIGPCIGASAFEVGPEVADEFRERFGHATPHVRPDANSPKAFVDLKGALREQLLAAGVAPERIDVLPHCTVRDADLFFSHRRDRGVTGRMVGIIGPSEMRAGHLHSTPKVC